MTGYDNQNIFAKILRGEIPCYKVYEKCSKGEFTKAEIAEALEKSARRKNTRIPVAFQNILSRILSSARE